MKALPDPTSVNPSDNHGPNDYLIALVDEMSSQDWRDILRTTINAAKNGDHHARNWLSIYLIGRPDRPAKTAMEVHVLQWNNTDAASENNPLTHAGQGDP